MNSGRVHHHAVIIFFRVLFVVRLLLHSEHRLSETMNNEPFELPPRLNDASDLVGTNNLNRYNCMATALTGFYVIGLFILGYVYETTNSSEGELEQELNLLVQRVKTNRFALRNFIARCWLCLIVGGRQQSFFW